MPRPDSPQRDIDWAALIDTALTAPGNTGDTYRRLYDYSTLNVIHLMLQGVEPQPVATYKRWAALGRHVVKGAKAKEIIRPITVQRKDEDGEVEATFTRFKPVRCVFPYSDTAGDDLPPLQHRDWDQKRALKELKINVERFSLFHGNVQGYSWARNVAVNPMAKFPKKTLLHECAHVVGGHTTEEHGEEYGAHRGVYEFEAEGSAYLVLNELEEMTPEQATVSRGYLQGWLHGERPPDQSIRRVFTTTDVMLKAGRTAVEGVVDGATPA